MKRLALIICVAMMVLSSLLFAETYFQQGFEESSSDTWTYTASQNRMIYWGRVNTTLGSASPYQGDWYWASWDLDNIPSALTFGNLNLPLGYSYQLSFYYYTAALNPATEYSRYSVSIDGGITWQPWVDLLPNSNVWTLVNVDLPAYAPQLMLKVEAKHDGMTKFAHWDNFVVSRSPVEPSPPLVYNVSAAQRTDGIGLVDVSYDLFDANNDLSTVSVLLATGIDGTYSYSPQQSNLTGDLGSNIALGTGKSIVWNAGAEGIDYDGSNYRIRVIADDGTIPQVAMPVFDPPGGTFSGSQTVSITCATTNVQVYYTLDGSEPDQSSELYTLPILISSQTMLKAKAYRLSWQASETAVAQYVGFATEGFIYVPSGAFTMGRTVGLGDTDELPTHSVTLNAFYIGKYEVSQAEYTLIMATNPASNYGVGDNFPVYYLSWYSVIKYCNLRSIEEGLIPCYSINESTSPTAWGIVPTASNSSWDAVICNWSANGYRIPTEAEWEYAARSATSYPEFLYSGSDSIDEVAWYAGNSGSSSHTVGTKAPNNIGAYDMSGNLFEWCWDWYSDTYYYSSPTNNPLGSETGTVRTARGGRHTSPSSDCRVSDRNYRSPYDSSSYGIGFRVVRHIPWVATPSLSHPSGAYSTPFNLTITCATVGATIHFTTDGSEPDESSVVYSQPLYVNSDTILKVTAFKDGVGPSETVTAEFYRVPENFIYVPGGTFIMGDTRGGGNVNEIPTHSVTLNPFYIGKYEVTQAEYTAIMGSNPASGFGVGDNFPVYFVSWYAAIKYCNLRSMVDGLTPVYSISGSTNPVFWSAVPTTSNSTWDAAICNWNADGYRLPTEAEWEYAVRGATNTPDFLYSGSDDINAVAWYSGNNSPSGAKPVGTLLPNALGIYDMSGNVYETCWDWFGSSFYSSSPIDNPTGPLGGSLRVKRGGYFRGNASLCRTSCRDNGYPYSGGDAGGDIVGFRVYRSIQLIATPSLLY